MAASDGEFDILSGIVSEVILVKVSDKLINLLIGKYMHSGLIPAFLISLVTSFKIDENIP